MPVIMTQYAIADIVYLRVRSERIRGMVTGIVARPCSVLFYVTWGNGTETAHYEIELSSEYVPDYNED